MKIGDSFGIGYAKHIDNEGFINFTIAHELGHYFLPGHPEHLFARGNLVHESNSGFVSNDPYEREADFFAAALLMPEKLFAKTTRSAGQGFAAVNALAQECGTSLTATAIRYSQFVEFPVAIILSRGDRIECCFVSDLLGDVHGMAPFRKGDLIPTHTPTAKFNASPSNGGSCNTETASCFLNDWFDDAPRFEMNEDVVGLGAYGKTLTVLFTSDEITNEDDDGE